MDEILEGMKAILEHLDWSDRKKVVRLAKHHGLPVRKIGGRWVARVAALDAWMGAALE